MNATLHQGIRPISDREFQLFQKLIHREAGIFLTEAKKALLIGRLTRRLRILGLADFTAYFEQVANHEGERTQMLDCICTNETRFFREPRQFEHLDREVFPRLRSLAATGSIPKRIRAWSAACSTGEEPYSLAMLLRTHFPECEGWSVEILASDLSTKALAAAGQGVWPIERAGDIPSTYRRAYMCRGMRSEEGKMRVRPELRSMIEFRQINLNDEQYPVQGAFDLIFCRNVLIYFNRETKQAVIDRLSRYLTPNGLLFLGHSETITNATHDLLHAGPTAYRRNA